MINTSRIKHSLQRLIIKCIHHIIITVNFLATNVSHGNSTLLGNLLDRIMDLVSIWSSVHFNRVKSDTTLLKETFKLGAIRAIRLGKDHYLIICNQLINISFATSILILLRNGRFSILLDIFLDGNSSSVSIFINHRIINVSV